MRRIVVSQRIVENESYQERRDALSHDWSRFVEQLLPEAALLPLPNLLPDVEDWLRAVDGDALLLSNGNDWGEAPERDETESRAFRHFREAGSPVLGVCRGMQAINRLHGGTIAPDIGDHVARDHAVELAVGPFSEIAGGTSLEVNSFHNQGVRSDGIGKSLIPFASAAGGIVEGLHHETEPILGIQWHPERDNPATRFDLDLLRTFFSDGAFWR